MAYEDVERLQPPAVADRGATGSTGGTGVCADCEPSALESPIRVELNEVSPVVSKDRTADT
jgi:hypothetical protein